MQQYDVFNGDADGICSLLQLRLATPAVTTLVTGIKRDIKLLDKVNKSHDVQKGDQLTVLDISMAKNKVFLEQFLAREISILYIDHHLAGDIPQHKQLHAIIDTTPTTCTSLLTNQYLQNSQKKRFTQWAVVGAYGDNMLASAEALADTLTLSDNERQHLCKLGIAINYNGYGASVDDLHYHPADLYQQLIHYADPLDCIADKHSVYESLYASYASELAETMALKPDYCREQSAVYILPDAAWARRVSGVFGNQLANQFPERAHSIMTHHPEGGYVVSVRAPKDNLQGAGQLCQQFATGGGREGAAGINQLPMDQLSLFIDRFEARYT